MEYTHKEIKKQLKCLARDIHEWNPGKDLPAEADDFLNKKNLTLDDFWAMRKVYALAGLNVTPPLFEKPKENESTSTKNS